MTQIAQGAHVYLFPEPGQVYRVQADDVATVQVIYGAPSAVVTLNAESRTFGPYDSPAKLKVSANNGAAEYTLIRAHYAELTPGQLAGGAVGVLGSNNAGGVVEPDGDVPSLGWAVTLPAMTAAATAGTAPEKTAHLTAIGALGNTADAIADTLENAPAADLARIQIMAAGIAPKMAAIGVRTVTVSGLGNSIMAAAMPWFLHMCAQSGGLFVAYDRGHGVPGNNTAQMLARVAEVPVAADMVVIQECTNDAGSFITPQTHYAQMKAICEFYIGRGQLPVLCFPPPRADNTTPGDADKTFQYGMIDYFLAQELGIPFVFPWRQFVTADAAGAPTAAMGATDNLHPGNAAHVAAGTAMLQQLLGQDHVLPLPASANTHGNLGLLSDSLHLTSTGDWGVSSGGANGSLSMVSDGAAIGRWARFTQVLAASYQMQKGGGYSGLLTGDELMTVYRVRTGGVWSSGFTQINPMQVPSYGNGWGGYAYLASEMAPAIMTGRSGPTVAAGTSQILLLTELNTQTGNTLDIAQMQVWNKTAIMSR